MEDLRLLNRKQAAAFIKERISAGSVAWLAKLARNHEGPTFKIIASRALYRPKDLEIWISEQWNKEPSQIGVVDEATPQMVIPDEPLADEHSAQDDEASDCFSGVDVETIALGLKIAAELAV